MKTTLPIPDIPEADRTPTVVTLLEVIQRQFSIIEHQAEEIQQLKAEIARLKKQPSKPQIRPSALEKAKEKKASEGPRPGSAKRRKTEALPIHETCYIGAEEVPPGSTFKGYQTYTVQDLEIKPHTIRYLIERWETPDGQPLSGVLPPAVQGSHFGPTLVSYILYQYYQCHVTQPLLLEELHEWGIDISAGQINRLLTENKDAFHAEKDALLSAGLAVSAYIHVDDTKARHQGQNGYCTHIGNEFFAWFESTDTTCAS